MSYTYTWGDAEQTFLRRVDADGYAAVVPVDSKNLDYQEYLASGPAASAYVAPAVVAVTDPLEARVAAIEANEISDDATDSALLSLIAGLTERVTALENQ